MNYEERAKQILEAEEETHIGLEQRIAAALGVAHEDGRKEMQLEMDLAYIHRGHAAERSKGD